MGRYEIKSTHKLKRRHRLKSRHRTSRNNTPQSSVQEKTPAVDFNSLPAKLKAAIPIKVEIRRIIIN